MRLWVDKSGAAAVPETAQLLGEEFDSMFDLRQAEADEFYECRKDPNILGHKEDVMCVVSGESDRERLRLHALSLTSIPSLQLKKLTAEQRLISRQAFAGLLWSKQFYMYIVKDWLAGDKIPAPEQRMRGRNSEWLHVVCAFSLEFLRAMPRLFFVSPHWSPCATQSFLLNHTRFVTPLLLSRIVLIAGSVCRAFVTRSGCCCRFLCIAAHVVSLSTSGSCWLVAL